MVEEKPCKTPTPSPLPPRKPSYLELLRQQNPALREHFQLPYLEQLRAAAAHGRERRDNPVLEAALDVEQRGGAPGLQDALVRLLAHTLASGREMVSGREIFWRLRVSPSQEVAERRTIARLLRSLGWVRVRTGKGPAGQQVRVWGWRWREWNTGQVKVDLET
jgi:hypothetical protein